MITDIRLQHYRSYDDASFEFGEGVNIIVGPNASGKTNLLEAVLVNARGSSYRAKDGELVAFGAEWARIDCHTPQGDNRTVKFDCSQAKCQKSFVVDEQSFSRLSLIRSLPVVLFEPTHLRLLSGSPERRREFLDDLLEQLTPGYSTLRRQYKRTLGQRNALLKHGYNTAHGQLFAWNIRLSELGGRIAQSRHQLISRFAETLSELYNELSHTGTDVTVDYSAKINIDNYSSVMLRKLEADAQLDFDRGFTGSGPHREDMLVGMNNRPIQEVASRGEIRTLLLVFKIIELKLLEDSRNQKPLLLLDDVFSELDGARRQALTRHLKDYQTFITTTDADVVVQHFMEECTIIPLS